MGLLLVGLHWDYQLSRLMQQAAGNQSYATGSYIKLMGFFD